MTERLSFRVQFELSPEETKYFFEINKGISPNNIDFKKFEDSIAKIMGKQAKVKLFDVKLKKDKK